MPLTIDGEEFADFDAAVAHVKKTKPEIKSPEGYVATIMHSQESIKEQITIFGKEFPDFDSAVAFVKQTRPDITNPAGYVSSIFRHTEIEPEAAAEKAGDIYVYTKDQLGYVDVPPTGPRCGGCAWFHTPNRCNLVEGNINGEYGCCNAFVIHPKKMEKIMKEAHTSTTMYGTNMNAELDEDSYMKQALAYLSAAVKAHNMEDQRPEMEGIESDFLQAAKVMMDNAWQAHQREQGLLEITTLDDIPTPTHGSSHSSSNMDWQGHNLDPHGIWMIIRYYIELKNRGIPDQEALRAIAMQFGVGRISGINTQYEPSNTQYWPLRRTGPMDTVDRIYPNLIPSSGFSPPLPPQFDPPRIESVAISGGLSNVSIGAGEHREEVPSMNGLVPLELPKLPTLQDNTNYSATGNDLNSQQSMHGEEGWVGGKQIPEESFYDPMNKSFSKRQSGIAPQTSKTSTQIAGPENSFGPNDHMPGESEAVIPRDQVIPFSKNDVVEPEASTREQVGQPPLKLRQMGKFHYSNHGHLSKHQEQKNMHVCEQLNGSVWEMSDPNRPIVPSEGAGITTTHPNCQCYWEFYTEIDSDPLAYASIRKPTLNGKSLEDFAWKGKAREHISDVGHHIQQKYQAGQLHTVDKDGKLGGLMECTCGCKKHGSILSMKKMRESLAQEFEWIGPDYMQRLKDMEKEVGPKFYLIRASAETITDHRSEGEPYRRKLDAQELWALARTGIGKGIDINHDSRYKTEGYVVDGDFDPKRREVQFVVHESDPEIIRAIDNHVITAVSINGGAPRMEFVAPCDDMCDSKGGDCELCLHPRGVVLGEQDGIAFTWVVTAPDGMTWRGVHMNAASPGVKVTKIEPLT